MTDASVLRRTFRPSIVTRIRDCYLVVDDLQPVAVLVSDAGEQHGQIAWTQLPAPHTAEWPRREVVADGPTAWVRDIPDGPAVKIDLSQSGELSASAADPGEVKAPRTGPYSRSRFSHSGTHVHGTTRWTWSSEIDRVRWTAAVQCERGSGSSSWQLGSGSVTSVAATETTAAVCVRRANKRPWRFRPAHDLYVLGSDGSERLALSHDQIDITSMCWPAETAHDVSQYVPYSLSECQAAIRHGATDAQLVVHDIETRPIIEIAFTLDGTRYQRFAEPIDELGRMWGGMRDLGIHLEEDLAGGKLLTQFEGSTDVVI